MDKSEMFNHKKSKKHMKNFANLKDKEALTCKHCFKIFEDNLHLKAHLKETHWVKCEFCAKSFQNKVYLNSHLLNKHMTNLKPHKCKECGKDFRHKKDLTKHMKYHDGEAPYKCEVCSMPFFKRVT